MINQLVVDKNFYVDTEVSSIKWHGVLPRKFVITNDEIKIAKKGVRYGFLDFIKPSLYFKFLSRNTGDKTNISKDVGEVNFDVIIFSDIKNIKLEKLRGMGDKYIILELKNGKIIKFFAVDEFNTKDSETEEIFDLISVKLNKPNI